MIIIEQKLRIELLKEELLGRVIDRLLNAFRNSKITDYEEWIKSDPEYQAMCDRIARESQRLRDLIDRGRKAEKLKRRQDRESKKGAASEEARQIATSIARKELSKSLGIYGLK